MLVFLEYTCPHRNQKSNLLLHQKYVLHSYLLLRGRCRYCQAPIPRRILWVEVSTGLLFAYLYWHYGLSIELTVKAFYFSVFVVLAVIDIEHKLILNKVIYSVAGFALIVDFFLPRPGILSGVIGAAAGLVVLLIPALLYPHGMGMGDVKMAALIGLMTGFPLVLVALFLSMILGGAVAIILVLSGIRQRKDSLPFGPFLSVGGMVTLLWGEAILGWYLPQGW